MEFPIDLTQGVLSVLLRVSRRTHYLYWYKRGSGRKNYRLYYWVNAQLAIYCVDVNVTEFCLGVTADAYVLLTDGELCMCDRHTLIWIWQTFPTHYCFILGCGWERTDWSLCTLIDVWVDSSNALFIILTWQKGITFCYFYSLWPRVG